MIARALTDEAFRTRLEQDPRETIETEFQCKVSGDVTFRVREEENPGEMTILLPKLPKKEMGEQLTDREIDDIVAAGNIGIAVGIVTTDIVLVKGIACRNSTEVSGLRAASRSAAAGARSNRSRNSSSPIYHSRNRL